MTIKPSQTIQPINRRTLLKGLGLALIPKVQNISPIPGVPTPRFWFGDHVSYCWVDDNGNLQDEFGQVVGVAWEPHRKYWHYSVVWTGSTAYPNGSPGYPSFDNELICETEVDRAYLEGELCKL